MRGSGLLIGACAMAMSAAPATARCWNAQERGAVQLRELQTMLMVSTLRCAAAGVDITPDYNRFVAAVRGPIEQANLTIKAHFTGTAGQADYDRLTTSLANRYGEGETTPATCDKVVALGRAVAISPEAAQIVARQQIAGRALPDGACPSAEPEEIAEASPTVVVAPVAAASPRLAPAAMTTAQAAPLPATPATPMPPEVAAALTLVARYLAAQGSAAATTAGAAAPIEVASRVP